MKFAPILAGGTLALVLATLSTAKPVEPPDHVVNLDLKGIDTLEIQGGLNVEIMVTNSKPPRIWHEDEADSSVQVRYSGNRMVIDGKLPRWQTVNVRVPASVHRFVTGRRAASVKTFESLPAAEVTAAGDFSWSGDVAKLVLRAAPAGKPRRNECGVPRHEVEDDEDECDHRRALSVEKGRIGEVQVYAPGWKLHLGDPDRVGNVQAWLGSEGGVSMDEATHFGQIHLLSADPAKPAP